ncbi:MAG: acyl-CoA thioesterase [Bacteroidales bacterium]|nr:acyl-CoA thioesterase [Bacteroidales bacterium]
MLIHETQLRVQYYETDQMGVVHHSNYIRYFEIGRTELMRHIGLSYKEIEDSGTVMPIVGIEVRYSFPARYDEIITIKSVIKEMPKVRMVFHYEIHNQQGKLLADGNATLAFVNKETGRPQRAPEHLTTALSRYFEG